MMIASRFAKFLAVLLCLLPATAMAASKTIGVVVYEDVLTSDVTGPLEVFGFASKLSWFSDYDVKTIGIEDTTQITTEEGLTLRVDANISDAPEVDILIVPSRYEMKSLLENKKLISFVASTAKTAEWMSSNCSGALLLAQAGLLDGKKATTWAGGEDDFQKQFPKVDVVHDKNYVIDGNVLTSNGSVVSYEAALALLAKISSEKSAQEVADTIQFGRLLK